MPGRRPGMSAAAPPLGNAHSLTHHLPTAHSKGYRLYVKLINKNNSSMQQPALQTAARRPLSAFLQG
eukprot:5348581-Alexandrium_andersonii.AAC.1